MSLSKWGKYDLQARTVHRIFSRLKDGDGL